MLVRACLLSVLLVPSFQAPGGPPSPAAARGPLTEAEVVFLLQSGVSPARVRSLAERLGVAFAASPKVLALIKEAGGDAPLLKTLRRRAALPPPAATATPSATSEPAASSPSAAPSASPAVAPTRAHASAPGPASPLEPPLAAAGSPAEVQLARFEVTNEQYLLFCSRTGRRRPPAPFWGALDRYPVVNVTWQDAVAYCRWLSRETGRAYRLPTAAEWERAARGGAQVPGAYPWGDQDPLGRSCFGKGLLCPVGSYKANGYGLHDMAGSVAEWCADGEADRRVVKGGSWASPLVSPELLAIAHRQELEAGKGRNDVGFRVAREP